MNDENADAPPESHGTTVLKRAGVFLVAGLVGIGLSAAFVGITGRGEAAAVILAMSMVLFLLAAMHSLFALLAHVRDRKGFDTIFLAGFAVLLSLFLAGFSGLVMMFASVDFGMG